GRRSRGLLRAGTRCVRWSRPLVADRLAEPRSSAPLGAGADVRNRAHRHLPHRAGAGIRSVRERGLGNARAGCAAPATCDRRTLSLCPQSDVAGGPGDHRGPGARPGPAGVTGLCRVVALAFILFVRTYEEPNLQQKFGAAYDAYRRGVPGWWPRRRPWEPW